MSMKQTALALACVGGCALAVVSPSFAASATAFQFGVSPAVVAQAAMVGSEDRPSESVEVVVRPVGPSRSSMSMGHPCRASG